MAITFGKKNPVASFMVAAAVPSGEKSKDDQGRHRRWGQRRLPTPREIDAAETGHLSRYHLIVNYMGKSRFFNGDGFEF
jgi:hypothetical protein